MRVEHREPQLTVTFAASSRSTQHVWSLTTNGAENSNRINGKDVKSRTFWQGDGLVTEWVTEANGQPVRDGATETTVTALKQ